MSLPSQSSLFLVRNLVLAGLLTVGLSLTARAAGLAPALSASTNTASTAATVSASSIVGKPVFAEGSTVPLGIAYSGAANQQIGLENWMVDKSSFTRANLAQSTKTTTSKAATDGVSIFRPVTPCRLIDTRGNGAPITGGPIASTSTRTIFVAGNCGIPTTYVTGLSLSFHAYNGNTAQNSVIAMMPVGGSTSGAMVGFHSEPMNWFMSSANVKTSPTGNFDIFVGGGATVDIIVDVNGYYQDMDELNIGTLEMDINANGAGEAFEVTQSGTGNAIWANAASGNALTGSANNTGNALKIQSGRIAVNGSSVPNSNIAASFVHVTSASTICGANWSIVKHVSLDNNPNAIVLMTPSYLNPAPASTFPTTSSAPIMTYYVNGCNATSATTGHWYVYSSTALSNNTRFNILIINQ